MTVNYLAEHMAILLVVALLYYFLYRRTDHYFLNRIVLMGTMILSILIPLHDFAVFPYELVVQTKSSVVANIDVVATFPAAIKKPFSIWPVIYVIGCLAFASFYVKDAFHLYRAGREGDLVKIGNVWVSYSGNMTSFSFLNFLFLENDDEVVLEHEMAHARLLHSVDRMFFALFHIVFWFNPLLLLYRKWLVENHEFSADELAIQNLAMKRSDYAQHLVAFGNCKNSYQALTNKFSSQLKSRIIMLNTNQKFRLGSYAFLFMILVGLCSGFTMKTYPVYIDVTEYRDTIPQEIYSYDTVSVFDAQTFTETVTVEKRLIKPTEWDTTVVYDPISKKNKVMIDKGVVGSSKNDQIGTVQVRTTVSIDTLIIFDPETYKESVIIEKVTLPKGVMLAENLSISERDYLINRIGEKTTLSISSHKGTLGIGLNFGAPHEGFSLAFRKADGTVRFKNISKWQASFSMDQLMLAAGNYTVTRSDGGQQVVVKIE